MMITCDYDPGSQPFTRTSVIAWAKRLVRQASEEPEVRQADPEQVENYIDFAVDMDLWVHSPNNSELRIWREGLVEVEDASSGDAGDRPGHLAARPAGR